VHNAKGFGIGLHYVNLIVEAHKGSIDLKSEKDKGSTFTIKLPQA
jgi:signal transduction histidine kinase